MDTTKTMADLLDKMEDVAKKKMKAAVIFALSMLLLCGTILFIVPKAINEHQNTDSLINESILLKQQRDSILKESEIRMEKIRSITKRDSLRKQEYEKFLHGNSTLSRDSLRRLFTES